MMTSTTNSAARSRQGGAALLMMMLVVLVSITAILVTRVGTGKLRMQQEVETRAALAEARQALLDYAGIYRDLHPGQSERLPCPDIDASGPYAEGEAHTNDCGANGVSVLGRLPWRTLGIAVTRDSSSACLWYAVSGSWKDAGSASATMINPDSNGLFRVHDIETGSISEGADPADRPVAIVFAASEPVAGQTRPAAARDAQCSNSFSGANFLDADSLSGISNANVSGVADTVDRFAVAASILDTHNDRIAVVRRAELERQIVARHDFPARLRMLGLALARCVADYGKHNSGGSGDRRLPWPAPLAIPDYRVDSLYNDEDSGVLSGRLPDIVDTSAAVSGNSISSVLSSCSSAAVPEWTAEMSGMWQHWKDHFFYVVADSHSPASAVPSVCVDCLSVNGAGQYAAIVMFGNSRLASLDQRRNAPPTDTDDRAAVDNYLEGNNSSNLPYTGGAADFVSQTGGPTFNDMLFCIDDNLNAMEC